MKTAILIDGAFFIVSQNKKYTALLRLAVLPVLSAACCLVSFLFWLTIQGGKPKIVQVVRQGAATPYIFYFDSLYKEAV